jgi:hypothetical protein
MNKGVFIGEWCESDVALIRSHYGDRIGRWTFWHYLDGGYHCRRNSWEDGDRIYSKTLLELFESVSLDIMRQGNVSQPRKKYQINHY